MTSDVKLKTGVCVLVSHLNLKMLRLKEPTANNKTGIFTQGTKVDPVDQAEGLSAGKKTPGENLNF